MDAAEIVVHEIERQRENVVVELLAESVGEPGEAPHRHTHREVVPLDVRGRNMLAVGNAGDAAFAGADARRGAVAARNANLGAVQLHKLRVIDAAGESVVNCLYIRLVAVCSKLDAIGEPVGEVVHELRRVTGITPANEVGDDQLAIGVDGGPSPYVASFLRRRLRPRDVLCLGVAERPDFIALDALRRDVADQLIVKLDASLASVREQLRDGVDRHVADPADRPHG